MYSGRFSPLQILFRVKDEGSKFLQNVGNFYHIVTLSHPNNYGPNSFYPSTAVLTGIHCSYETSIKTWKPILKYIVISPRFGHIY
jgi:hypothetical protein